MRLRVRSSDVYELNVNGICMGREGKMRACDVDLGAMVLAVILSTWPEASAADHNVSLMASTKALRCSLVARFHGQKLMPTIPDHRDILANTALTSVFTSLQAFSIKTERHTEK